MPTKTWTFENVVDDNVNTVRDILTTLWDRSIDGYQQVGTDEFYAENHCQNTLVQLVAPQKDRWRQLYEIYPVMAEYSDGYTLDMRMMMGQQMEAGSIAGTCIQNSEKQCFDHACNAICIQGSAGDDGFLSASSLVMRVIPQATYEAVIAGDSAASFATDLSMGSEMKLMTTMCHFTHNGVEICGFPGEDMPKADVEEGLGKFSQISGRMLMPKETSSRDYVDVPRFHGEQRVYAYGYGLGAGEQGALHKCGSAVFTGASNLIAASAVAFGSLTAFMM